jgi:hypothetical protein
MGRPPECVESHAFVRFNAECVWGVIGADASGREVFHFAFGREVGDGRSLQQLQVGGASFLSSLLARVTRV